MSTEKRPPGVMLYFAETRPLLALMSDEERGQLFAAILDYAELDIEARLHHHLVVNGTGKDLETLQSLWPYGEVLDVEYIGERGYDALAAYVTKESVEGRPVGAQMWTASRNMIKPVVESAYVPNDTMLGIPLGCYVLEKEEKVTEAGA